MEPERRAVNDDLCQCPSCGRMHRNLGFGKPPVAVQRPELVALEMAVKTLREIYSGSSGPICKDALNTLDNIEALVPAAREWRS